MAHIALGALESWLRVIPEEVQPHLSKILPWLNDYLLITEPSDREDATESAKSTTVKNSVFEVQLRIVRLLGKIGGLKAHLLDNTDYGNNLHIAWDPVSRLKLSLPFPDSRPEIVLGRFSDP